MYPLKNVLLLVNMGVNRTGIQIAVGHQTLSDKCAMSDTPASQQDILSYVDNPFKLKLVVHIIQHIINASQSLYTFTQ